MSLMVLAENLASKGRNGDSVLVHMTPEEVRGLHALAAAHGGGLTINPETGLPEANFLKRLLPAIIGLAITATTGIPAWQVGLGVGAFETARTGDLGKGIMAGLGAYGGASFGASINTAGEAALASSASQAAFENVNPAVFDAGAAGTTADVAASAPISAQQAAAGAASTATPYDKFIAGAQSLGTDQGQAAFMQSIGGAKGAFQKGYLAATPVMAGEAVEQKLPPTTTSYPDSAYITPYIVDKYGNLRRAGKYRPGEFPGFEQLYTQRTGTDESPTDAANGGLMKFADGGSVMMSPGMLDFVQRSEPVVRMADGGFTNEQIYNTYQNLLGQGMSREQILEAAQRNPNIGLNAGQIDAALAQYQKPAFTDQQFLDAGRTALQGGLDPQTALQRAAEFGATQDQLNRLTGALGTSGITGLTTPTSTLGFTPPATGGLDTLAKQVTGTEKTADDIGTGYGRATTVADTGAGIAGLGAANPFQAGMRQGLYGEFLKAQQSGNWSDFSRKAQEMNMGAEEIAALFPNISAANVTQFAKERGFELGKSPITFGGQNIQQFLGGDQSARNIADQLATMTGINLTPEQKADIYSKIAIGSPIDMRPFLAEALEAAIAKKDYSRINDVLAKYDISKSELKNIFNNVNNPAIDEFEKRGLTFNALPDWVGTQRWIPDKNVATDIAKAWKKEYGRDISPDELKTLSFQLGGTYPNTPEQVLAMVKPLDLSQTQAYKDAEARGERYIPGMLDVTKAGFSDVVDVGSVYGGYDWNKILASADPRASIIATNRLLAEKNAAETIKNAPDTFEKIGEINGVPVLIHNLDKGRKVVKFDGANVDDPNALFERFFKLGFGSDEMNKLADIADKSGIKYKPGEKYAGSDAGLDLRDIARGGYGTTYNPFDYDYLEKQEEAFPDWAKGSITRYDTTHKGNYYADQLGLSLNRKMTSPYGYVPMLESEVRPITDKEGKLLNYAVRSGGGFRYFRTAEEAAKEGQVIDLTGRSPTKSITGDVYRPGDVMTPPKAAAEGYLYQPSKAIPAPKTATTPTTTTTPTATTPTTGGGLAGLAGAGAGAGTGGGGMYTPGTSTMGGIRDAYTQGGGSTGLQNIGEVRPGQNVYTQNNVVSALQEYMKANPGASYNQVLARAQQLGVPEPQLRAALNEFRFDAMTGGSKAAYDYLMGRGAYPTSPTLPKGVPVSRPYAEAMGIPTTFQPVRLAGSNTPTGTTLTEDAPKEVPKVVNPQGTQYSDLVAFYFDANPDVKEAFEKEAKNMSPEDYVRYHWNNYGKKENRKGYYEKLAAEPATPADTVGGGASGGLTPFARGGLSALARAAEMGASRGGQFNLGDYSDGGRLLRGPGDGVSDSIPATIGGKRPARLADGEFVVPARIVSELGNGSTEAGARKLYAMMDRIQAARRKSVGKGKVAKNTRADKYLPA